MCADADPPHEHWMAYVPTAILLTETIFLALCLYKAWESRKQGPPGQILTRLVKQSVFYFFAYVHPSCSAPSLIWTP